MKKKSWKRGARAEFARDVELFLLEQQKLFLWVEKSNRAAPWFCTFRIPIIKSYDTEPMQELEEELSGAGAVTLG